MENILKTVILSGIVTSIAGCGVSETKQFDSTSTSQVESIPAEQEPALPIDINTHARFENQTDFTIFIALNNEKAKVEPNMHIYLSEAAEAEYSVVKIARKAEGKFKYLVQIKYQLRNNWIESFRVVESENGEVIIHRKQEPSKLGLTESVPLPQPTLGSATRRRIITPKEPDLTSRGEQ